MPSSTAWRSRFSASSRSASARARDVVAGHEELERLVGMAQPAGGVDPRREPESHIGRRGVRAIDARHRHQRAQARLRRAPQPAQARAHEAAVLVAERNDVGDRREGDQVEVALELGRIAPGSRVQAPGRA